MQKENKMGTERISRLLITMGLPIILSMMLQALYNIADSYFVSNMPDYDGIIGAGEQAVMSVMNYAINIIFGNISEAYVTAYGIFYKIQQFVLFAAFGLRDAITPIVSFNYGRMAKDRLRDGIKYGLLYTTFIMAFFLILLEIFARPLSDIFSLSAETSRLCTTAMRVVSVSFIFAGFNIAFQGIFQALDAGIQSLVLSLLRQIVIVLPAAWIFSLLSPSMVWVSFIIAEAATSVVGAIMLKKVVKKNHIG